MKRLSVLMAGFALAAMCAIACGLGLASVAAEQPSLPDPAKFHIYLLAGQSNMAGRGELTPSNRVSTARVLKMDKEGRWVPAEEPIHFDVPFAGAGLGASFARAMVDADPDVTIGLVPCAVGGSPMWRWDPGTMYYTNTIARAKAAMKVGTLKGILWHQGCSEANVETNAFGYAARVAKMMRSFRKDLGAPDTPIVAGELGWFLDDVVGYTPSKYWRQVNTEINLLPRLLEKCAVVSSEGLTANADNLHFNTPSQRAFGLRYAKAMRGLQTGELRIGIVKLNNVARKVNAGGFGGRAFTAKGVIDLGGWESYQGLENDILAYFKTGRPPRTLDEELEIYAFMEAARRSQAEGGRQIALPKP